MAGFSDCPAWADAGSSPSSNSSASTHPAKKADAKAKPNVKPNAKPENKTGKKTGSASADKTDKTAAPVSAVAVPRESTPAVNQAPTKVVAVAKVKPARSARSAQDPVAPDPSGAALLAVAAVRDERSRAVTKNSVVPTAAVTATASPAITDTSPNVLVIGVDGTNLSRILSNPANTNFFSLMQTGTTAPASIVGHTTISNPSWTAILTGLWGETTGVINNIYNPAVYSRWPTVFNQLETYNAGISTTAIADWDVISAIAASGTIPADHIHNITQVAGDSNWSLTDDAVGDATKAAIAAADKDTPNFIFSYFVGVDENGHAHGGGSQQYADAVTNVDRNIGGIMQVVNQWEAGTGEQWTVIVVTDHGHQASQGFGHGFQSPNETSTFVIANNPDLFSTGGINTKYSIVDVTPTVVTLFGGTPARTNGVSLTDLGGSTLFPINTDAALRGGLQDLISKYGYPNIGTDLSLGLRTVAATVPYLVDQFTTELVGGLQSVAAKNIFLVSPVAQVMTVPVKLVGDLIYAATNVVAQVIAGLTGVTGASIFPLFVPALPPLVGTEDPAPVGAVSICVVASMCVVDGSIAA